MLNKLRCHIHFQQIRLLDQGFLYTFTYLMTNSADRDQLVTLEANWSVSTLFAKAGYIWDRQNQGEFFTKTYVVHILKNKKLLPNEYP